MEPRLNVCRAVPVFKIVLWATETRAAPQAGHAVHWRGVLFAGVHVMRALLFGVLQAFQNVKLPASVVHQCCNAGLKNLGSISGHFAGALLIYIRAPDFWKLPGSPAPSQRATFASASRLACSASAHAAASVGKTASQSASELPPIKTL